MNRSLDWLILRYLGYATVFLVGLVLLYMVRGTLPIFMVALLLAYAFEPLLQLLERRGYSRRGAVGLVFLMFLLLFVMLIGLLAAAWQQLEGLKDNFPKYELQLQAVGGNLQQRLDDLHLPKDVKLSIVQAMDNARRTAPAIIGHKLSTDVTYMLGSVGTLLLIMVVLPIITFWMMMEMHPMRTRVLMLVPPLYRRDVTEVAQKINEVLGRYVRGQLIVCSLFGLLCTISFHILSYEYGMAYPLVLGLCAGLLYMVPYLGMATLSVAAGTTAYFTSNNPVTCALLAVGTCVLFSVTIDYGISPRVIGQGVGLHPVMVIFALLSGAQLGGIPGMILAVPFFASLRVILIYLFPQLAAPISETPPETEDAGATGTNPQGTDERLVGKLVRAASNAEATVHQAIASRKSR